MRRPIDDFWCERCKAWTPAAVDSSTYAYCDNCGTEYECAECGSWIYRDGACSHTTCLQANRGD